MLINVFKVTHLLRGENRNQAFVFLFPELFPQQCSNAISLFNRSGMSDSLRPHGLQHARLLCPLPSLGVCPNSCPLSRWCHPTISSSAALFSFCLQCFAASVFPSELALRIRWPRYWSFSFSISPSNEYSELISFRIHWSPCSPRESQESSPAPEFESTNSSSFGLLYGPTHICTWLLEKPQVLLYGPLLAKWCLCFFIHCLGWS